MTRRVLDLLACWKALQDIVLATYVGGGEGGAISSNVDYLDKRTFEGIKHAPWMMFVATLTIPIYMGSSVFFFLFNYLSKIYIFQVMTHD